MAQKLMAVCDVPVRGEAHGIPATHGIDLTIDGKDYHADICDEHMPSTLDQMLTLLGIGITPGKSFTKKTASRDSLGTRRTTKKAASKKKIPQKFTAKSGTEFTAADARGWLIEQGHLQETRTGRIGKDLLNLYAEAH